MTISLDIDVGDVVLGGKFKNKRIVVKNIGKDKELNQPTINGKPLLKVRIEKDLPKNKQSKETKEEDNKKMKITTEEIKQIIKEELSLIKEGYDEFGRKLYSGKNDSFAMSRDEYDDSFESPQWDDYFDNERESGDGNEEDAMNALENALDSGDIEKAKKATERLKQLRRL